MPVKKSAQPRAGCSKASKPRSKAAPEQQQATSPTAQSSTGPSPRKRQAAPEQDQAAAPPTKDSPPPGLNDARHAAEQRAAGQAEVLAEYYVPACLANAISIPERFNTTACRAYLDRFLADAGNPRDPVERVLLEQIAFANLRVADLHARAAEAKSVDAAKVYSAAAARLLSEVRRLALALQAYRTRIPTTEKLRVFKAV